MNNRPIQFNAKAMASKRRNSTAATVASVRAKVAKPSLFARMAAWLNEDV